MSGVCWQRPSAAFHVVRLALEEVQSLMFLLAGESGQQNKAGRGKGREGFHLLVTLCAKLHPDPLWQPCLSANTGFGRSRRKDLPCKVETVRLTDIYWPKWRTSFLLTISKAAVLTVWAVTGAWVLSGSVKETDVSHSTECSGAWRWPFQAFLQAKPCQ